MKKVIAVLTFTVAGLIGQSCSPGEKCPAYTKVPIENFWTSLGYRSLSR